MTIGVAFLGAIIIPAPVAAHGVQGDVYVNVTTGGPDNPERCNRDGRFGTCYDVRIYPHPGAIGLPPGAYTALGHIESESGSDLSADHSCAFLSPLQTACNTNGNDGPFALLDLFENQLTCYNTHGVLREALLHLGGIVDEHRNPGGCVQGGGQNDAISPSGTLFGGETMYAGYYLLDDYYQAYTLEMQGDGNLVIYKPGHIAVWATDTNGHPGAFAVLQSDGNFVVYSPTAGPVYATGTVGTANPRLVMQSDCNLVLYGQNGAVWASGTNHPNCN